MDKSHLIKQLEGRKDRTEYTGKFSSLQEFGSSYKGKRYSQYEQDPYSEYQNFLYKRALFGLKMYTQEEIKAMHTQKRKRIMKVHRRAQHELNLYKQEKFITITNKILGMFNGKSSSLAQELIDNFSEPDPKFKCNRELSFKDLGIEKKQIISMLIKKGVLPPNFEKLNETKEKAL